MNAEQFFELLKGRGKISYFELYNEFFNGNEEEFKNLLRAIAELVDKGKVVVLEIAGNVVLMPRGREVQGNLRMFAK
jgi:translation initiation factor 2 alpha subunit (eIF-2alpha)